MYGCSAIIDGVFLCACMHRHVAMQLQCHAYTVYRRVGKIYSQPNISYFKFILGLNFLTVFIVCIM